jgi:hypothetical protein
MGNCETARRTPAVLGFAGLADHRQDSQHLMTREYVAEQAQFFERLQFAAGDLMPFDERAIGRELSPIIGRPLRRLNCISGIHDRGGLGMREKKNLLPANPERIFESSHQRERRFALTALEVRDVTGLHPELFCQRALRQPEFQALLFYQPPETILLSHIPYSMSSARLSFAK